MLVVNVDCAGHDKTLFLVKLGEPDIKLSYQVERSYEDFQNLHTHLSSGPFPDADSVTKDFLTTYLHDILREVNFAPWDSYWLNEFFGDGQDIPPLVKFQLHSLKNEIRILSQRSHNYEHRLYSVEHMINKFQAILQNSDLHPSSSNSKLSVEDSLSPSPTLFDGHSDSTIVKDGVNTKKRLPSFVEHQLNVNSRSNVGDDCDGTIVTNIQAGGNGTVVTSVTNMAVTVDTSSEATDGWWNEVMTDFPISKEFERDADDIVRFVQPRDAQFKFRSSSAEMIKDQISKALNSNAFDISFYGLKCFLPDDPIKLTVILNHSSIATWHKVLYDRLIIVSEHQSDRLDYDILASIRARELITEEEENERVHKIKDVRMTSDSSTFKVLGMIDSIPFEIVANSRVDLCMLTFFEEINALVGNDHLFKRSMLLIRSWWMYETASISDKSLKEYLPDFAIWLMVTAIFNQHHSILTSPMQALYLFLTVYSNYDGSSQAITLQGIRSFLPNSSNLPLDNNYKDYLINQRLFEKYYQVVNIQNTAALQELANSKIVKVDRSGFNVVHPFTFASMTLEKLSTRKSEKILGCFKAAAGSMKELFRNSKTATGGAGGTVATVGSAMLKSVLFSETFKKLCQSTWRPDVLSMNQVPGSLEEFEMMRSPRDVFDVQIGELWHNILYCNFILEAVVSESALLSLCTEVLTEKKILPVGEVGKTLSDVTAIPNLSSQLREKFGGLKKFLERYPEIFLFSKDHPFNPNVVLRKSLNADQIDQVERGIVSLQALFKAMGNSGRQHNQSSKKNKGGPQQPGLQQPSVVSSNNAASSTSSSSNNAVPPLTSGDSFSRPPAIPNTGGADDRSISTSGTGQSIGRVGETSRRPQNWTPFMENNTGNGLANPSSSMYQEGRSASLSNDWASGTSEMQSPTGQSGNSASSQNPPLWIGDFSLNGGEGDRSGGAGRDYDDHSQGDSGWGSSFGTSRGMGAGGRDFVGNSSGGTFYSNDNRPQPMPPSSFDLNGKRGAMRFSNSAPPQLFKQQSTSSQPPGLQQARPNSWEIYPTNYHRSGNGGGGNSGNGGGQSEMSRSFTDFSGSSGNNHHDAHSGLVGLYGSNNPGNRQSMMKQSQGQQQSGYGGSGHGNLYSGNDGPLGSSSESSFHHMSSNQPFGNRKYPDWS